MPVTGQLWIFIQQRNKSCFVNFFIRIGNSYFWIDFGPGERSKKEISQLFIEIYLKAMPRRSTSFPVNQ